MNLTWCEYVSPSERSIKKWYNQICRRQHFRDNFPHEVSLMHEDCYPIPQTCKTHSLYHPKTIKSSVQFQGSHPHIRDVSIGESHMLHYNSVLAVEEWYWLCSGTVYKEHAYRTFTLTNTSIMCVTQCVCTYVCTQAL